MKEEGAELSNIILKSDGTEYLWHGDPKFLGRHAPILFPIVGRIINVEPWFGVAEEQGNSGELSNKKGIISLTKNENFTCQYVIKIY